MRVFFFGHKRQTVSRSSYSGKTSTMTQDVRAFGTLGAGLDQVVCIDKSTCAVYGLTPFSLVRRISEKEKMFILTIFCFFFVTIKEDAVFSQFTFT